jgi:DNA-binding Lrp family transcriptional regulator
MTDLQAAIITLIQAHFPIGERPYEAIGQQVGCSEQEAFDAVQELRESGQIRRIGASIDARKVGYRSTLCALSVPEERVAEVAELVDSYPNVTHNYLRVNHYNMWFTLIAPSQEAIVRILDEIKDRTGLADILDLPATRLFKIKVDFKLTPSSTGSSDSPFSRGCPAGAGVVSSRQPDYPSKSGNDVMKSGNDAGKSANNAAVPFSQHDISLLRILQEDIAGSLRPFQEVASYLQAQGLEIGEAEVIAATHRLLDAGAIRRFGAMVRHQRLGFNHNVMVAWKVSADHDWDEQAGQIMAAQSAVSHCYERPVTCTWPYNLYSMVHGRSEKECQLAIDAIDAALVAANIPHHPPAQLRTIKELKKTSMRYFME